MRHHIEPANSAIPLSISKVFSAWHSAMPDSLDIVHKRSTVPKPFNHQALIRSRTSSVSALASTLVATRMAGRPCQSFMPTQFLFPAWQVVGGMEDCCQKRWRRGHTFAIICYKPSSTSERPRKGP